MDSPRRIAPATSPAVRVPPRPADMHPQRHKRLVRTLEQLRHNLDALPGRRVAPHIRKRAETQFTNRMLRIRRALHLPVPVPPVRDWYRLGQAARLIGISTKTLERWIQRGRVQCQHEPGGRRFARRELLRVIHGLKV